MPRHKKHPSVRARRNKASTAAKLERIVEPTTNAEAYSALTVAKLKSAIDLRNGDGRSEVDYLSKRGTKASLVAALMSDDSPVPKMPAKPDGSDWHPQTREWWESSWRSPMATQWDPSDLHNVTVVALLYDDIWNATSAKVRKDALAEFRLQRADLGLSPYSRRRLEWTFEAADEAKARGERRRGNGRVVPTGPAEAKPDPRMHLVQ